MSLKTRLFLITIIVVLSSYISLPKEMQLPFVNYKFTRVDPQILSFRPNMDLKLGLDLAGGSHIVFEADMSEVEPADRDSALEGTRSTIERRVNLFGVSEAVVQTAKVGESYRIIVELPGVQDTQEAIELIGQTAKLEFWEAVEVEQETPEATEENPQVTFAPTGVTGADLVRARVQFDPNTGKPTVALEFNQEGADKFAEVTRRNIGKPLLPVVDGQAITSPIVQSEITEGRAVIQGDYSLEEARRLETQLNAGALPVSVDVIEQRSVGPTLGQESIDKSVKAGLVGLSMVVFFMASYYGSAGIIAATGLLIYAVLTLAIYKLAGVVLTLPGVAGFILSVGMAVDANILIFERMKEELRKGIPWEDAMEKGFGRAWDSIRDANIATLLTTFILFNPLNWNFLLNSGPVRGFALTLGLGIFVGLFTGIFVTRSLMRAFYKGPSKLFQKISLKRVKL